MLDPKINRYEFSELTKKPRAVAFADLNFFSQSLLYEEFSEAIGYFDIIYCDGYWLYRMLRFFGYKVVYMPGPEFFNKFIKAESNIALLSKYKRFEIPEVLRYENLNIITLPFVQEVNEFNFTKLANLVDGCPDIFVSLGCPKQELFISRIIKHVPEGSSFYAVGAAVDFWLGKEKRAPRIFNKLHLEFFWRLIVARRKQLKKWKNFPIVLIWFIKNLFLKIFRKY